MKRSNESGFTMLEVDGFPPDWVGAFVYDRENALDATFEAMTQVNHECIFFAPNCSGLSFTIESFLFKERKAHIASELPREIQVLCA